MRTFKIVLLILAGILAAACGIKSPPIPKSSLNIPYPDAINVSVTDKGILIENMSEKYTVLAERSETNEGFIAGDIYKRISLITPRNSYLDKEVKSGITYIYRFKNFYPEYNTYSPAVTRTLKYYVPVTMNNVKIKQEPSSICINADMSSATNYVSVNLNGKEAGDIKMGQECFDLPNSLIVNVLLIPYDFYGNPGTPYQETLKRDENIVLLPPQNARALREGENVILSWDKAGKADEFLIYIRGEDGNPKLLESTNITIYKYQNANPEKCTEFEISSQRDKKESDRVKISSCP